MYISGKLRNELNLPTLRRKRFFIKTFGNSNSKCNEESSDHKRLPFV